MILLTGKEEGVHGQVFDQMIQWFEDHERLSGWAQAIGAVLALAIAIAIPAWQRRVQRQDMRLAAATAEVVAARATYFLLVDVRNWLRSRHTLSGIPRDQTRNSEAEASDLLARIHALEASETSGDRVIALFRARGAIFQTSQALTATYLRGIPLSSGELELLAKRLEMMDRLIDLTRETRDTALYQELFAKSSWVLKPVVWAAYHTEWGRRTLRALVDRHKRTPAFREWS